MQGLVAVLITAEDILSHDDGVVDHDPQHHDECKQRYHVDGDIDPGQEQQAEGKRNRDAEHDPQGQTQIEKQPQHGPHQQKADQHVAGQQFDTAAKDLGAVPAQADLDTVRERGSNALHIGLHGRSHLECVLIGHPVDIDQGGGLALKARKAVHILEAVPQGGDVFQAHGAAVRAGDDRDVPVVIGVVAPPFGADQNFAPGRFNAAGRQVEAAAAHQVGHLPQGQSVTAQGFLGNFDMDLGGTHPGDISQGDAGQIGDFIPHPLGQVFDGGFGRVSVDGQVDDITTAGDLADERLFSLVRKGREAVDL